MKNKKVKVGDLVRQKTRGWIGIVVDKGLPPPNEGDFPTIQWITIVAPQFPQRSTACPRNLEVINE
jgi:hypothetical protein